LPVGWPSGSFLEVQIKDEENKEKLEWFWNSHNWWVMPVGWLITAIATLFGAPFWFDSLQTVIRLKGTGPSPEEKKDRRAASA
jgi:hypothetical protein